MPKIINILNKQKGQSVAEVLIAMTLFVIISSAVMFLILGSHRSNMQSQEISQAVLTNQEGLEAVKSIANNKWTDLECYGSYTGGPGGNTGISNTAGYWQFKGVTTSDYILDKYSRQIAIIPLYRNDQGEIIEEEYSGAILNTFDPYLRKIIATTTWEKILGSGQSEIVYSTYISNWNSVDFADTANTAGQGFYDPDPLLILDRTEVTANGVQLKDLGGIYELGGTFTSRPYDTGVVNPSYNFIFFNYE